MPLLKRKPLLLVLDDDASMRKLIGTLLRRGGYRVHIVSSGSEAIEKVKRADYDALLLDVMTPTEGGLTVIKYLREKNPDLLKRVVLVTASPDSVLREPSKDIYAVLHKPFEPRELMELVKRLLGT